MSENNIQDIDNSGAEALLPDGIGLSLEEIQKLLAAKHETAISKDDPVLMEVTIMNAFLEQVQRLHLKHEQATIKLLADKTDSYVSGVQTATKSLTDTFSTASAEGVRKAWADNMERLAAFRTSISWNTAIIFLSALVNVVVFILLGLR